LLNYLLNLLDLRDEVASPWSVGEGQGHALGQGLECIMPDIEWDLGDEVVTCVLEGPESAGLEFRGLRAIVQLRFCINVLQRVLELL